MFDKGGPEPKHAGPALVSSFRSSNFLRLDKHSKRRAGRASTAVHYTKRGKSRKANKAQRKREEHVWWLQHRLLLFPVWAGVSHGAMPIRLFCHRVGPCLCAHGGAQMLDVIQSDKKQALLCSRQKYGATDRSTTNNNMTI